MVLFEIFLSKKSYPNIHQNAPNCTIFKKFSGGHALEPPHVASRHANFQISKKKNSWPPLPNPGNAPESPS